MTFEITIAVVPRDRFSKTAATIARLLAVTPKPFRLVVVDAGMPQRYRLEVERTVSRHPGSEILRKDYHIDSNAAKNWVLRETPDGEFLAFVENDVLVEPGWLGRLVEACAAEEACVARPMILERKIFRTFPHFDRRFGSIETVEGLQGVRYLIRPRKQPVAGDVASRRRRTTVLETHCLLFRRAALTRIGGFDERVTTRQEVDLGLQLYDAGIPIVFEPASVVTYLRPPPVYRDEREYFLTRWDYASAVRSHETIRQKWPVEGLPSSLEFVRRRRSFVSYSRYGVHYARREFVPYLRYELEPNVRYALYRWSSALPQRLRDPIHRRLYG